MSTEYNDPARYVLDGVRFSHQGTTYKGQGFMEWNPATGFRIDALLDKTFNPVDAFKTLGQIIVNTKEDAFPIWLKARGQGWAFVPDAFPIRQKQSFAPDNHFSMKLRRVLFFSRIPPAFQTSSEFWSGSALYLTTDKFEFPDNLNTKTELAGRLIFATNSTGLSVQDNDNWCISGRQISGDKFELTWALNKNRWQRRDAWRFGEAARRALSIISAQMVWIARQELSRGGQKIVELRRHDDPREVSYYFRPLLGDDGGVLENWHLNKVVFLKLTDFFLHGGANAETCWTIFCQMADASHQQTRQGQELLLATVLEATLRTIYKQPFQNRKSGLPAPQFKKKDWMERFRVDFLGNNWSKACEKALEVHTKLRHRNAHPDWLSSPDGKLSKAELKESSSGLVFLSRFYGYMILAMAGFKDLKPLFPNVRFSDET